MYIYIYIYIYVFPYTLRSRIDVSPAINLSEIFHSGLCYSSHHIYLFLEQIPNTTIVFTSGLVANITISLHCVWMRMFSWFSDSSWGDFAFDLRVFSCWHREHSLLPLFPLHTHTHTHTHSHTHTLTHTNTHTHNTHNTHTHTTHTHYCSSHLFSGSGNIVKVI